MPHEIDLVNAEIDKPQPPSDLHQAAMKDGLAKKLDRRHDLDALRAIAMLLGIGLHAALSFEPDPSPWPTRDIYQSGVFRWFNALIHGFRMPLFFLLSGFFTAMLWRKRGLTALLKHRFQRIFIPMIFGLFTIVPLVWIVSIEAGISARNFVAADDRDERDESQSDIENATDDAAGPTAKETHQFNARAWQETVRADDAERIRQQIGQGADVNAWDSYLQVTPLAVAAIYDKQESARALLDAGADPNRKNQDGTYPLHAAAAFGRPEMVRMLLDAGADPELRDQNGARAVEALYLDWGTTEFFGRILNVPLEKEIVMARRAEIAPMLDADPEAIGSQRPGAQGAAGLLFLFPVWHHLWFLMFLCWLVLGFAVYALLVTRLPWTLPRGLLLTPVRYLWIVPLTFLPAALMGRMYPVFGPDTSVGLLPLPHVLGYYAIFFGFGALYFDCGAESGQLGRWWKLTLPVSLLVLFPVGYELTMGTWGLRDQWISAAWHRPLSIMIQVLYAWAMTFGLIGLFRDCFSARSPTMRYLSDSAYWLYLAHLPLVMFLQRLVRYWDLPAAVKFVGICFVTSAILLVSYEYLVRYTFIGATLNGRKTRMKHADAPAETGS